MWLIVAKAAPISNRLHSTCLVYNARRIEKVSAPSARCPWVFSNYCNIAIVELMTHTPPSPTGPNYPHHVAFIPDGNRRWAKEHGLKAWDGHRHGLKVAHELFTEAAKLGIPYVTFWAASEDNLRKRSRMEVKVLALLLREELADGLKTGRYVKNQVRVRIIGRWHSILKDEKLLKLVKKVEAETRHFTKNHLTLLFGYDGHTEMLEAMKKLKVADETVSDENLRSRLWTGDLPQVDLVIRTGGEPHWSAGFMMWHVANAQLYFTDAFWPAFRIPQFHKALAEYTRRERRFGK